MAIKYKKIVSVLVILAVAVGLAGSMAPSVQAATGDCIADNSKLCTNVQCSSDSHGNATDCTSVDPAASGKCTSDSNSCDFVGKYINPAIKLLTGAVGVVAVISIIYAGIQYTTSAGDPKRVSDAKNRITQTVLALLAYAFLYAFLQFLVPGGIFNRS